MEKNLNAPVVKLMMRRMPPYTQKKDYGNDLLLEDDLEGQNVMMELGELDDLTQIYGEMGEIL